MSRYKVNPLGQDLNIILRGILVELKKVGFTTQFFSSSDGYSPQVLVFKDGMITFQVDIVGPDICVMGLRGIDQSETRFPLSHPDSIENVISHSVGKWGG